MTAQAESIKILNKTFSMQEEFELLEQFEECEQNILETLIVNEEDMDNDDDDEDDDGTGMEEVVLSDELIGELTDVTLPNGERTFVTKNLESNVEDEREEDELSLHDDDDSTLVLRDISGLNDGNIIELQVDSTDETCLIDDGRVYSQLRLDDGNVVYIVREDETSKDATESFDQQQQQQQQPQESTTTIETTEVEEEEEQPIVIQVAESEVVVAGEINNSEINDQSINGLDLSPINNVTSHKIKHNNQTTLDKSRRNAPNGNCKISRINASSNDGGSGSSSSGSIVAISDKPSCRDYNTRDDDKEKNDEDYDEEREVAAAESTAATTAAAAAKKKPFSCEASNCRKTFPTYYSLKAHLRTHSDEKPFKCSEEECDKRFKTSGDLTKHVRTHTGERPFVCPFEGCGRSFTTSNIRKVHVRTHTGERPFKCKHPKCGKAFASLTNYKNHVRIHSGEKPYICMMNNCGRRFTEYSSLYKHNLVHKEDKPYECDVCRRQYRQNSTLSLHKRTAHKIVVAGVGAAAAANNNNDVADASSTTIASSDAKKELEKNLNQSLVEDDEIMFEKLLDSSQDMIISHASKENNYFENGQDQLFDYLVEDSDSLLTQSMIDPSQLISLDMPDCFNDKAERDNPIDVALDELSRKHGNVEFKWINRF
ncbi:zinc finger protein 143-like isoform X1 [Trichogramma pretiosum]|uniref:zinc finger protein 143-like isoform X1 n=1 Tax=Trichogramma pretiosum TaxID=7493 RepID=UPI0006C97FB3|nr:zinc finger protein 143-like isoform X1 [Trichogramma pretiosum]